MSNDTHLEVIFIQFDRLHNTKITYKHIALKPQHLA